MTRSNTTKRQRRSERGMSVECAGVRGEFAGVRGECAGVRRCGTRYLSALVGVHHVGRVRGRTA